MISALRGGSGKTILSVGIIAAWNKQVKPVIPFKKGPDYIDSGWLALAAGRPCYNLDTFLVEKEIVRQSFYTHATEGNIAVIEGNRGLYDGIDKEGTTSTAELAKILKTPVILCVDCTKTTRTMAAVICGCIQFDPEVQIKGVVLNRVAGKRHENILRRSIEFHSGIPVVGAIPKLRKQRFPERHMGLVPTPEHNLSAEAVSAAERIVKKHVDLETLFKIAGQAPAATALRKAPSKQPAEDRLSPIQEVETGLKAPPKIGIIRDSAFQFYYPDNIEALVSQGAEVIFISPFENDSIPLLDALYIGGGFPETHVKALSDNRKFRRQLKSLAEDGLPIYAECGGLMYLGEALVMDKVSYPMAGVFALVFGFSRKPQGHGYTVVKVAGPNPYYAVGTEIRGHEFHYSRILAWKGDNQDLVFDMQRGNGIINKKDGVRYKNVLATYTHIHALGTPAWAGAMIRNALNYRLAKQTGPLV